MLQRQKEKQKNDCYIFFPPIFHYFMGAALAPSSVANILTETDGRKQSCLPLPHHLASSQTTRTPAMARSPTTSSVPPCLLLAVANKSWINWWLLTPRLTSSAGPCPVMDTLLTGEARAHTGGTDRGGGIRGEEEGGGGKKTVTACRQNES
jgi:hypothetical protein